MQKSPAGLGGGLGDNRPSFGRQLVSAEDGIITEERGADKAGGGTKMSTCELSTWAALGRAESGPVGLAPVVLDIPAGSRALERKPQITVVHPARNSQGPFRASGPWNQQSCYIIIAPGNPAIQSVGRRSLIGIRALGRDHHAFAHNRSRRERHAVHRNLRPRTSGHVVQGLG